MKRIVSIALALAVSACAAASAQQNQGPPCSGPEFRQMDFWLGEWEVSWGETSSIPAGRGVNIITRELDGCVIQEAFDGGPSTGGLVGHSVSVYHSRTGLWRQTWVDNYGGYFALTGGPEGEGHFVLSSTRLSESAPYQRMVFENITHDSLTWRWQRSEDAGQTWADAWVIEYRRRGA